MMIILSPSQASLSKEIGTTVLFPAPGGACKISVWLVFSEDLRSSKTS